MIISSWRRIILGFRWPTALPALAVATVVYYILARWLQDRILPHDRSAAAHALLPAMIQPEPYELPLYLIGYAAIPLLAMPLYWLLQQPWLPRSLGRLRSGRRLWVCGGLLVVAGVAFGGRVRWPQIAAAGAFAVDYLAREGLGQAAWLLLTKRLYAVRLMLGLAALVFVWLWWRFPEANLSWLRSRLNPRWLIRLEPWLPVALAMLVFDPTFPYDRGHYNFVLAPVNDMLAGKRLLYETSSLYGILNTYLLAALFRWVVPLSYAAFSAVVMAFYFGFFVLLYFFLKRWLSSRAVALLGTLAGLATYVYLQSGADRTAYHFPGTTPYRQGWYLLVAAALLWASRAGRDSLPWWRRDLPLQISAVAAVWNLDAGMAAMLALVASLALDRLARGETSRGQRIRSVCGIVIRQFGYLGVAFGAVHFGNFFVSGDWPRWEVISGAFATGVAKVPLPAVGMFEFFILTYLVAALVVVRRLLHRQAVDPVFTYVLGYAVLVFAYFVSTSAWSYLYPVAVPLVLVAVYLFWDNYLRASVRRGPVEPFATRVLVSLGVFVALVLAIRVPFEFAKRDYAQIALQFTPAANAQSAAILSDAWRISREFPVGTRVALAHRDDSQLLLFARRANLFPIYNQEQIRFDWQLEESLEFLRQQSPGRLLIGDDDFLFRSRLLATVASDYERVAEWRTLAVYQRITRP